MRIRTVYFMTTDMEASIRFWRDFLGFSPHKKSQYWSEFKCENGD